MILLNISYTVGAGYRVLSNLTRLLMGQGVKREYQQAAILATKYQNSHYRNSQVWTIQALALPRGAQRRGNVLRTPTDTYRGMTGIFGGN